MSKIDRLDPQALAANPRARLSSWYKYQEQVQLAYQRKPQVYRFEPLNRTPNTVASQIRDAIRGCLAFGYPVSFCSHAELAQWWQEVVVKHTDKEVFIGPPEEITDALKTKTPTPAGMSFSYDSLSFEEVAAFSVLLSAGRIPGPVHVTNPPDTSLLPARPNFEMMNREDGSLILL